MTETLDLIRSRGLWRVVIRPTRFENEHVDNITVLPSIVESNAVRIRGWDYPHYDRKSEPTLGLDWVGQDFRWEHYLSSWRFFQTGQFVHYFGMGVDWRDVSGLWPAPSGWQQGTLLGVGDTVLQFMEIFEFAARLAISPAGDEEMHLEVALRGLQGRELYIDEGRRVPFLVPYRASITDFPAELTVARRDLIAQPVELALKQTQELFRRFGWDVSPELLRDWQQELRSRR